MNGERFLNRDFVKMAAISAPIAFGQAVQGSKDLYGWLKATVGDSAAGFVKGHVGNLLTPIAAGELGAWVAGIFSNRNELAIEMGRLVGVALMGLTNTFTELSQMGQPLDPVKCKSWNELCGGDPLDLVLTFLPTIVLGLIYGGRVIRQVKENRVKSRDRSID